MKRNLDILKREHNNLNSNVQEKKNIIRTLDKEQSDEKNINLQMDLYDEKNIIRTLNKEKTALKENVDSLKRERNNLKSSVCRTGRAWHDVGSLWRTTKAATDLALPKQDL